MIDRDLWFAAACIFGSAAACVAVVVVLAWIFGDPHLCAAGFTSRGDIVYMACPETEKTP